MSIEPEFLPGGTPEDPSHGRENLTRPDLTILSYARHIAGEMGNNLIHGGPFNTQNSAAEASDVLSRRQILAMGGNTAYSLGAIAASVAGFKYLAGGGEEQTQVADTTKPKSNGHGGESDNPYLPSIDRAGSINFVSMMTRVTMSKPGILLMDTPGAFSWKELVWRPRATDHEGEEHAHYSPRGHLQTAAVLLGMRATIGGEAKSTLHEVELTLQTVGFLATSALIARGMKFDSPDKQLGPDAAGSEALIKDMNRSKAIAGLIEKRVRHDPSVTHEDIDEKDINEAYLKLESKLRYDTTHDLVQNGKVNPEDVIARAEDKVQFIIKNFGQKAAWFQFPGTAYAQGARGKTEYVDLQESVVNIYATMGSDIVAIKEDLAREGGPQIPALKNPVVRSRMQDLVNTVFRNGRDQIDNIQLGKKVESFLSEAEKQSGKYADLTEEEAIKFVISRTARKHSLDVIATLVQTGVNSVHSGLGDVGPLLGMAQKFGLREAITTGVSFLPYTFLSAWKNTRRAEKVMGIDHRGLSPAEDFRDFAQAGVSAFQSDVNLLKYVFGGVQKENSGARYSILSEFGRGAANIAAAPVKGLFAPQKAFIDELRALGMARGEIDDLISSINNDERFRALIEGAGDPLSQEETERLARIIEDAKQDESMGPLANEVEQLIESLRQDTNVTTHDELREAMDELKGMSSRRGLFTRGRDALKLASQPGNRTLRIGASIERLVNMQHYADEVSPEIAEVLFIVTGQGMHIPFLSETIRRDILSKDFFRKLPLEVKESILFIVNSIFSSVCDNWADVVLNSDWMSDMYKDHFLDENFGGLQEFAHNSGNTDLENDIQLIRLNEKELFADEGDKVGEVFEEHIKKVGAAYNALLSKYNSENYPEAHKRIQSQLNKHINDLVENYDRTKAMVMQEAVFGGELTKYGNAPAITATDTVEGYDFKASVKDVTGHPIYHILEAAISAGYAHQIAPRIIATLENTVAGGGPLDETMQKILDGDTDAMENFKSALDIFEHLLRESAANATATGSQHD